LEKRIEGVREVVWRKNEVWSKVNKKGKNCFKEVRKEVSEVPKKWGL